MCNIIISYVAIGSEHDDGYCSVNSSQTGPDCRAVCRTSDLPGTARVRIIITMCALRFTDLVHYTNNAASDVQGVLQEIERVTALLDFHSKELPDMHSELVGKRMQVYSLLLFISMQQRLINIFITLHAAPDTTTWL